MLPVSSPGHAGMQCPSVNQAARTQKSAVVRHTALERRCRSSHRVVSTAQPLAPLTQTEQATASSGRLRGR